MAGPIVVMLGESLNAAFVELPLGRAAAGSRGIRAGLSLARAGDMNLARRHELPSRSRLLGLLGVAADRLRSVQQVHSRSVVRVVGSEPADGPFPEADGMVSDRRNLLLAVTVADCLPIFLLDRRTGAFGIVHSGWKGTGIVVEAIRMMATAFGSRTADLSATIGPGIGACCYAVPRKRYEAFASEFGPAAVSRGSGDDYRLDLGAANLALLDRQGVADVAVVAACTACNPALGSFRREGPRSFTRMLAFIGSWDARGCRP